MKKPNQQILPRVVSPDRDPIRLPDDEPPQLGKLACVIGFALLVWVAVLCLLSFGNGVCR